MHDICMVFPSYWSRRSEIGWQPGDAVYDHPIPVDEEGTLLRALRSLNILNRQDFSVIVLAVPTTSDINDEVEDKVSSILCEAGKETSIPLHLFGPSHLEIVHRVLAAEKRKSLVSLLQMRGYSPVRNLCLFVPHLFGADTAILIDDDEVFEDPEFIDKAMAHIGKNFEDVPVRGVAGYYLQSDGTYKVQKKQEPWMTHWNQVEKMNEAFDAFIGHPPAFKQTPFVFGGNMVVHRDLFMKVPFDPLVPRGEDIDYLMNARMFGFTFFLDTRLSIKHLPPPKSHPVWRQMRADVFRFLFEREKLRKQREVEGMTRVFPEDFDPYPGVFLKDDLENKVTHASSVLSSEYRRKGDIEGAREALKTVELMRASLAENNRNPFEDLLVLQKKWENLMALVDRPETRREMTVRV